MKKARTFLPYVVLAYLLIALSNSYALEGNWKLINNNDIKLSPSIDVQFEFAQSIGPNLTIQRNLIVHACYQLNYTYEVTENNIFLSFQNILSIPRKCVGS